MSKTKYLAEYNYYQALSGWRGTLTDYIKWRNTCALKKMQDIETYAQL